MVSGIIMLFCSGEKLQPFLRMVIGIITEIILEVLVRDLSLAVGLGMVGAAHCQCCVLQFKELFFQKKGL